MSCLDLLFSVLMRRAKRILVSQNYSDKFYSHSILTVVIQMAVAFNEAEKFARTWCNSSSNLASEIVAVKEIFEIENKDDATWMTELISNKYINENIDRLIYLVFTVKH